MRNSIATLITAAALAAPIAHADGTPITVELKYDSTLLATDSGAKAVLKSIKAQASDACTSVTPVSGLIRLDRDCRDDLVDKAIGKIRVAALEDGLQPVYVFAAAPSEDETLNQ